VGHSAKASHSHLHYLSIL